MTTVLWAAGLLVRLALVLFIVVPTVVQVRACSAPPRDDAARVGEVRAQLAFLGTSLRDHAVVERMQTQFPEGACFLATLHASSWAEVARASTDDEVRVRAAEEVTCALGVIASPAATSPFEDTQVRRGVLWAGQRNLVLAELLALIPEERRDPAMVEEFHTLSRELADAFVASPTHHLETYPGGCWPADQVAALASLVAHDRLFATDFGRAARAWIAWTTAHLDPTTGLPAGRIDGRTGAAIEPARGCGTSWILALLPRIDPALAREFWRRYVDRLGRTRLGFRVFAEWPEGADRDADVDSGPIVWGAGTAATGIGLAAARANGDLAAATDIYSLAQALGLPSSSHEPEEKSYLCGEVPIADAFLAFGLSIGSPPDARDDARGAFDLVRDRWKFHALVTTFQVALLAVLLHGVRRSRRKGTDAQRAATR